MNKYDKIYSKLIKKIIDSKIEIDYQGMSSEKFTGLYFSYHNKHPSFKGIITLYSKNAGSDSINIKFNSDEEMLAGIIYLAHEYGHSFSNEGPDYDELNNRVIKTKKASAIERKRILNEENFAWNKAAEVLKELEFDDWDKFNKFRNESIKTYEDGIK